MNNNVLNSNEMKKVEEREITKKNGGVALCTILLLLLLSIGGIVAGGTLLETKSYMVGGLVAGIIFLVLGIVVMIGSFIAMAGLHIINPNEALVLTLFGNYYGTLKQPGYYFTNPFCSAMNSAVKTPVVVNGQNVNGQTVQVSKKISTKLRTLNNEKQKVNDVLGNPIIIGSVVIWKVVNPTKAALNVENYMKYLSTQCDSTIRNIARLYPYDDTMEDETGEKTLRGSSQEIADSMKAELQQRVEEAGLEIQEVRINHLAYAEEIAAAMLQRQQATAIIAARKKIVEGAVSMVKMAIDELGEEEIVVLDEERKAAMVSNLLVVLCGNKDAQPIVNSGSIY